MWKPHYEAMWKAKVPSSISELTERGRMLYLNLITPVAEQMGFCGLQAGKIKMPGDDQVTYGVLIPATDDISSEDELRLLSAVYAIAHPQLAY